MITGDMLRAVPLLADVPDSELNTIAGRAADIGLHTNEWLIQEGEVPRSLSCSPADYASTRSVAGVERAINEYVPGDRCSAAARLSCDREHSGHRAFGAYCCRCCGFPRADRRLCRAQNARLLQTMATRIQRPATACDRGSAGDGDDHRPSLRLGLPRLARLPARNHVAFRGMARATPKRASD